MLATQTLVQSKAKNMRVTVKGPLGFGVTSKDVILHIIGVIGTAGGTGHVIEFAGLLSTNAILCDRWLLLQISEDKLIE